VWNGRDVENCAANVLDYGNVVSVSGVARKTDAVSKMHVSSADARSLDSVSCLLHDTYNKVYSRWHVWLHSLGAW